MPVDILTQFNSGLDAHARDNSVERLRHYVAFDGSLSFAESTNADSSIIDI